MLPDGYGDGRAEADAERVDLAHLHALPATTQEVRDRLADCQRHGLHVSAPGVGCPQCENEAAEYARRNAWRRNEWKESKR